MRTVVPEQGESPIMQGTTPKRVGETYEPWNAPEHPLQEVRRDVVMKTLIGSAGTKRKLPPPPVLGDGVAQISGLGLKECCPQGGVTSSKQAAIAGKN